VTHHRRIGYRHFVIDHVWRTPAELSDLRRRLIAISADPDVRCFLLTLPIDEHLRRIERRQQARAIDERAFEQRTVLEEREALARSSELGEPFDVSAPPSELVAAILSRLASQ
jgi:thymidylate kinase